MNEELNLLDSASGQDSASWAPAGCSRTVPAARGILAASAAELAGCCIPVVAGAEILLVGVDIRAVAVAEIPVVGVGIPAVGLGIQAVAAAESPAVAAAGSPVVVVAGIPGRRSPAGPETAAVAAGRQAVAAGIPAVGL